MKINKKRLVIKKDNRGRLIELIKGKDIDGGKFGQILITTALPEKTKGNHYHKRKREWYVVVQGTGLLILKDIKSNELKKIILKASSPLLIEIPRNVGHAIKNIGKDELLLLAYVNEEFNPKDPDTFYLSEQLQ